MAPEIGRLVPWHHGAVVGMMALMQQRAAPAVRAPALLKRTARALRCGQIRKARALRCGQIRKARALECGRAATAATAAAAAADAAAATAASTAAAAAAACTRCFGPLRAKGLQPARRRRDSNGTCGDVERRGGRLHAEGDQPPPW